MRRPLLTATALTVLLAAVPASAAFAGERTGEPMEEPDNGSDDPDEVRDRQPAGEDKSADDPDGTAGDPDADAAEDVVPSEPGECREPEVTRSYTAEAMVMSLEVDLRGCDWWDGSALELVGIIGRDDGSEGSDDDFAFQAVVCADEAKLRNDPDPGWRVVGCAIEVVLPHPAAEVAYYYGGISWIWRGERHRVDLDTTCVSSPAGTVCRDEVAPAVRGPGIRT